MVSDTLVTESHLCNLHALLYLCSSVTLPESNQSHKVERSFYYKVEKTSNGFGQGDHPDAKGARCKLRLYTRYTLRHFYHFDAARSASGIRAYGQ